MTELKRKEWKKVKRRKQNGCILFTRWPRGDPGTRLFIYFGTGRRILWAWWIFIYIYFWIYFVQRGPVWLGRPATGPSGFPQVGSEEPDGVQKPSMLWKQDYFLWSAIPPPWSCAGIGRTDGGGDDKTRWDFCCCRKNSSELQNNGAFTSVAWLGTLSGCFPLSWIMEIIRKSDCRRCCER